MFLILSPCIRVVNLNRHMFLVAPAEKNSSFIMRTQSLSVNIDVACYHPHVREYIHLLSLQSRNTLLIL